MNPDTKDAIILLNIAFCNETTLVPSDLQLLIHLFIFLWYLFFSLISHTLIGIQSTKRIKGLNKIIIKMIISILLTFYSYLRVNVLNYHCYKKTINVTTVYIHTISGNRHKNYLFFVTFRNVNISSIILCYYEILFFLFFGYILPLKKNYKPIVNLLK